MYLKQFIPLFLILAITAGCTELSGPSAPSENTMNNPEKSVHSGRTVLFYNVENLFDTEDDPRIDDDDFTPEGDQLWDNERYQHKLNNIAHVFTLLESMPILVGLVEVENREVLEDLTSTPSIKNIGYRYVHFDSPDRRGVDCALLYDPSAFTVVQSTKLPVRLEDDPGFATRDILYVHGKMGDTPVHVFVNHWSSRREGKDITEERRIAAAKTLRREVDRLLAVNKHANILILGDFNDHPDDISIHKVLRAKESGFEGEGDLINLLHDDHKRGSGTAVHMREWGVLDQIIISTAIYDGSAGLRIRGNDATILKAEELLFTYPSGDQKPNATFGGKTYYGGYSDHLPVYITLE